MELKSYQKVAIKDLTIYLEWLDKTQDIKEAYTKFWEEKGIRVGFGGVPYYNNTFKNVPHLCFKVPTGGGKTFMACSSIKPI
ncbi:MAG: DEAD/DEAH box helicase family protein, partial [Candidatus Cloacimonetes bacterium]|nr:DEAD/DEAH box helicase family protein [Candidatus Cloacimonadota bacterium]